MAERGRAVEALVSMVSAGRLPDRSVWEGRRVLVTGHTGFKGSWLVRWLSTLGAEVHGVALDPPTEPSLFADAHLGGLLAADHRIDVTDAGAIRLVVAETLPDVVLHLAAQPLVRDSYRDPARTVEVNVTGTANVLDAVAALDPRSRPEAVVVVTSDKVYAPEGGRAHVEDDRLGGHDPYSASKAMCEMVVDLFRDLPELGDRAAWSVPLATARAGNVIGGGDWAHERLVPDCIRSFRTGRTVELRYPDALRPWQHVLEPLGGYLVLTEHLLAGGADAPGPSSVNFGPDGDGEASVADVAGALATLWGDDARVVAAPDSSAPENPSLRLDSSLAAVTLGWRPRWTLESALQHTVAWYRCWDEGGDVMALMDEQITHYSSSSAGPTPSAERP